MDSLPVAFWIVLASECIAIYIIWRLWRADDHIFFKVCLSLIALIPILGPVIAYWIANFPGRAPDVLQVPRDRGYFFTRWRHVLDTQNAVQRFRFWRNLVGKHRHEDP